MATASDRVVTVFGGTGFLGRRIVRHLRLQGFCVRVASRHPDRGHALLGPDDAQLRSIEVDVRDQRSVSDALADAYGGVNAVSLYLEQGPVPFAAWGALALISEMLLPSPPITRNQLELMQIDSTPSPGIPGLEELGISPHSVEEVLRDILRS